MWIQGTGSNTWPCWSKWRLEYTIVGIVTRLWAGACRIHGSICSRSKRFFLLQKCPDQLCCPSIHTFNIQKVIFPWGWDKGSECLGHVADHSYWPSVEIKKASSYTFTPPYLMTSTGRTSFLPLYTKTVNKVRLLK
jgi:hypothetical protein